MVAVHLRLVVFWCGVLGAMLLLALRYDPARAYARGLRAVAGGFALLSLWNLLPLPPVGVNPLAAVVAGSLGLPGAGLLCVLRMLP